MGNLASSHMLHGLQYHHCTTEKPAHQPRLLASLLRRILQNIYITITPRHSNCLQTRVIYHYSAESANASAFILSRLMSTFSPQPSHLYTVNQWMWSSSQLGRIWNDEDVIFVVFCGHLLRQAFALRCQAYMGPDYRCSGRTSSSNS